jgi:DNA-binding GntR family transcriptional regulator
MASTETRKRRRTAKVADMTTDELREMIESSVERTLVELLADPDSGLELRPEIAESLRRQEKEYAQGKRGKSLEQVAKRLGLD